jgi:VanZ family protein
VLANPGTEVMLKYIFQYKFSVLLALVIVLLSLLPDSTMPHSSLFSFRFFDKIVHFSMYGAFGFTALLESRCTIQCVRYHSLLLLFIFILSAVIEVLQATVVETRAAEWLDLLANGAGLISGYIAFRIFKMIIS